MDKNIVVMPEEKDHMVIVDEAKGEAYLLKRYEDGLTLNSPEYVYIGEQKEEKKEVSDDSHRSIEICNPRNEKFTGCGDCIHDGDTSMACKQRGCTHAFSYLRECFDPKDCHPNFYEVNHSVCCENNI